MGRSRVRRRERLESGSGKEWQGGDILLVGSPSKVCSTGSFDLLLSSLTDDWKLALADPQQTNIKAAKRLRLTREENDADDADMDVDDGADDLLIFEDSATVPTTTSTLDSQLRAPPPSSPDAGPVPAASATARDSPTTASPVHPSKPSRWAIYPTKLFSSTLLPPFSLGDGHPRPLPPLESESDRRKRIWENLQRGRIQDAGGGAYGFAFQPRQRESLPSWPGHRAQAQTLPVPAGLPVRTPPHTPSHGLPTKCPPPPPEPAEDLPPPPPSPPPSMPVSATIDWPVESWARPRSPSKHAQVEPSAPAWTSSRSIHPLPRPRPQQSSQMPTRGEEQSLDPWAVNNRRPPLSPPVSRHLFSRPPAPGEGSPTSSATAQMEEWGDHHLRDPWAVNRRGRGL